MGAGAVISRPGPERDDPAKLEAVMNVMQVKVILSGGPADLATMQLSVPEEALGQTLKVRHGAGYEHFLHHGEYRAENGYQAAVFCWTGRTKIAE